MATTVSTVTLNTGQQAIVNSDTSKIFVGRNKYSKSNLINNSGYNPVTYLQGTVMGRSVLTNSLKPCASTSNDGSQFPVGILAHDVVLASGATNNNVFICEEGDVIEEKLVFFFGDTLASVVSSRNYRDRIGADTVGINLVSSQEQTDFDNQ